ncbi:3'-5' RNA helicase YTHDC2-like [Neocloeon triangulifer]|uniref:3'-5' RNA helicase YTHDC2-like n=1 Tax=Neocloeon triangulifer TaxID=2078957 RepID=UPI00286EE485|nr:3'-5' RNA helicase YTHDC2-like [Neocloeon triangulifer]
MPRKKQRPGMAIGNTIEEEVKMAVGMTVRQFLNDHTRMEHSFPSSLTREQRAFVHQLSEQHNLKSKSRGKGPNRFLTIFKRDGSTIIGDDATLPLGATSIDEIQRLLSRYPVTPKERQEVAPYVDRDAERRMEAMVRTAVSEAKKDAACRILGRLSSTVAQVPPQANPSPEIVLQRAALPITVYQDEILNAIAANQVTIICGETGSGKTTQVPQYLLEQATATGKACRLICGQPRRIAAVSVSERVAAERGEELGTTIGYQVRLESKTSPRSVLTYCTYGVLLRSLMAGDTALASVSHVIVDEVHERDRHCDFLLLVLRDMLARCRGLRLVLMSATADLNVLTTYFRGAVVVNVPGKLYDVEEFYLEDILRLTGYEGAGDSKRKKSEAVDAKLINQIDEVMEAAWNDGSDQNFGLLLALLEGRTVDHRHTYTQATALMIAAAKNRPDVVAQLLSKGADPSATAFNDFTALEFAVEGGYDEVATLLKNHAESGVVVCRDQQILESYQKDNATAEENIDHKLVAALVAHLSANSGPGAILVFLPGYEDIVEVAEKVNEAMGPLQIQYRVFMLHSNMQMSEQKQAFKVMKDRKIVLATNIAETSITIEDVVYVIDCGKLKEKSLDAGSGICQLRCTWISKACAKQRCGRAGRLQPGQCFRMYSKQRFQWFMTHATPEILRLPLHELCLAAKLLAPFNTSIADFLAKAPEPPPPLATRNAVNLLKLTDALTPCEDLTELGQHLVNLAVEPRLGKCLLFAILLRCLDPVLTIVCTLAHKEPFQLPSVPFLRHKAHEAKRQLSAGSFSDHMTFLRAFLLWQESRSKNRERRFCEQHFISHAVLEMVTGLRSQLLGQLRASGFVRTRGGGDLHELNQFSDNWAVIKAALTAGLYPNLARVDRVHQQLRTRTESRVRFHPSSVLRDGNDHNTTLAELPSDWVLYEEMGRVGRMCHARTCTVVSPVTVFLMAGPSRMAYDPQFDGEADEARCQLAAELESDSENEDEPNRTLLRLDEWASFRLDPSHARALVQLRQKLHSLFLRKLKGPTAQKAPSQGDDLVVRCVVAVLSAEDKALKFPQPLGIGQKPRTFDFSRPSERSTDSSSATSSPCLSPNSDSSHTSDSPIRYLVIKNGTLQLLHEAVAATRWTFAPNTLRSITKAQREGKTVVAVFSIQGSGGFQGYARLGRPEVATCPLQWLKVGDVPFQLARHLHNPWHNNQRVQHSRDGQALEPRVGEALCQLWDRLPPHPATLPMPHFMQPEHIPQSYGGRAIRGNFDPYRPRGKFY